VPFTYAIEQNDDNLDLGDIEAELVYSPTNLPPGVGLVFHGGAFLPTGSAASNDVDQNLRAFVARLPDLYQYIPDGLTLRFGVSPMLRQGRFFMRGDLAVDLNVSSDNPTTNPGFALDLGAGAVVGSFAVTAEVDNYVITGTGGYAIDSGAIAARLIAGRVQPYLALIIPVDANLSDALGFALTLGVDYLYR